MTVVSTLKQPNQEEALKEVISQEELKIWSMGKFTAFFSLLLLLLLNN